MSFDIEGVYSPDNRKLKKLRNASSYAGITVLRAVMTPFDKVVSVKSSISKVLSETMSAVGVTDGYINDGSAAKLNNQPAITLPNQLLSDIVELDKPVNPLISEAQKY